MRARSRRCSPKPGMMMARWRGRMQPSHAESYIIRARRKTYMAQNQRLLQSDEVDEVRREAAEVVLDPDQWLRMPNDQLGGRQPIDLVRSGQKQQVLDLIEAIKYGMFT